MEARRNVLVGAFVLVGLGALCALVLLFGRGPTWLVRGDSYPILVRFRTAEGIRTGTTVTVYGQIIGRVHEIGFLDQTRFGDGVNVTLMINRRYRIPEGTRAETVAPGFGMGRPPIALIPGPLDGPALESGATIPGTMASAMESVFPSKVVNSLELTATQIGSAADALTPVLRDLHELMQRRSPTDVDRIGGPQGNLSSAMARLDSSLAHFNTVLGDPQTQSNVRLAVDNFAAASTDAKALATDLRAAAAEAKTVMTDLKTTLAAGQSSLKNFDDQLNRVSRAATDGLERASRMLDFLTESAQVIARGEGTLGKLVRDDRLYEAAVLSFGRFGELVQEMIVLVKDWQQGKIRVAF